MLEPGRKPAGSNCNLRGGYSPGQPTPITIVSCHQFDNVSKEQPISIPEWGDGGSFGSRRKLGSHEIRRYHILIQPLINNLGKAQVLVIGLEGKWSERHTLPNLTS